MRNSLSLFVIEDSLALLAETREAAEEEGDAAAVEQCDKALAEYLTAEAAKVDSYAALIRRVETEKAACELEANRLTARASALHRFRNRLKDTALEVMQRFNVKELKSATNTLRRQANGGIAPLEVDEPKLPQEYRTALVLMPLQTWERLEDQLGAMGATVTRTAANTDVIRKALAQQVICQKCSGAGTIEESKCPVCEGSGAAAQVIAGAKLLARGEHVRIS
jgi:hypothetical protein